jgi:hypothetical protein
MGNLALFISPWDSDLFSNVYFTLKKKESLNNVFCYTFIFVTALSFSLKFHVNLNNIKIIFSRTTENTFHLNYKDFLSMVITYLLNEAKSFLRS